MTAQPDPARDALLNQLLDGPWRFEFAQAVRVLLRNSAHGNTAAPSDRRFDVDREPVRIGAVASMGFPASDIHELAPVDPVCGRPSKATDPPSQTDYASQTFYFCSKKCEREFERDSRRYFPVGSLQRLKMLVSFLGLTGPSGVMPQPYSEFVIDAEHDGDHSLAEFLDIFNHRLAMLFYYAWERYRFPVIYERRPDHDLFRRILLSLVGLGTEHLTRSTKLPADFFATYAALLAIEPRSASTLETILCDYFQAPVSVEQFAGTWYQLDPDSQTRFRDSGSESDRLGYGVVVSEEYWSQESMARLRIGPLKMAAYRRFLRGGPDFERLREICRFFSRDEMVFEAQLILDRDDVPGARLESEGGSQLGWTTWARSETGPFPQHAEDVVIRL